jgi:hypothetical protein
MTQDLFDPIEIYTNTRSTLLFLAVMVIGLALFCFCLFFSGSGLLLYLIIIFLVGFCYEIFKHIQQLCDTQPKLTISREGILDSRFKIGVIKWSDIEKMNVKDDTWRTGIGVKLKHRDLYLTNLSWCSQFSLRVGGKRSKCDIEIDTTLLEINPMVLGKWMESAIRGDFSFFKS